MSTLPNEVLLQTFHHTPPCTLWTSVRPCSKQLRSCAEDTLRTEVLPRVCINLTFSLGGGSRHRWYDLRATIIFNFSHLDKHNPGRATFKLDHVLPDRCGAQALEKWMHLREESSGNVDIWRVELNGAVCSMPLQQVRIEHQDGQVEISFDWRAMFQRYFCESERLHLRLGGTADA